MADDEAPTVCAQCRDALEEAGYVVVSRYSWEFLLAVWDGTIEPPIPASRRHNDGEATT